MKFGPLKPLFAAAVAAALALPVIAQQDSPVERRQSPGGDAARDASGADDRTRTDDQSGREEGQPGRRAARAADAGGADDSGTRDEGNRGQRGQISDQGIVRWIAAGNEGEIQVNEFAQSKAQHEQVKQFAQQMVEDHTKLGETLRNAARDGGRDGEGREGAATRPGGAERTARRVAPGAENVAAADEAQDRAEEGGATNRNADRNADRQGNGPRGGNNPYLALHEEIKRQCTESTLAELREKEGAEFDKAFIGGQIHAHMGMLDTLKVAQMHASPELKQTLADAQSHVEQHLQKAKQIMEQIKDQQ